VFARVRERGYVTYNEVNAALPHDQVSSEFIEEVLTMLTKIGVSIVEGGAGDPEA
jgi:RNA polymerase primary sigma factor